LLNLQFPISSKSKTFSNPQGIIYFVFIIIQLIFFFVIHARKGKQSFYLKKYSFNNRLWWASISSVACLSDSHDSLVNSAWNAVLLFDEKFWYSNG